MVGNSDFLNKIRILSLLISNKERECKNVAHPATLIHTTRFTKILVENTQRIGRRGVAVSVHISA